MNKVFIGNELHKRGVEVEFFMTPSGPAIRFVIPSIPPKYWNALLPIDDESDPNFVDFVESYYQKYYPIRVDT